MAHSQTVNLTSLSLIQGELVAEIEHAAAKLERFVVCHDDPELLQGCIQHIESITGSLSLIQLSGADTLAREILQLAKEITPGELTPALEKQLEVMSESFFVLPRYLEYVQQSGRGMPSILLDSINKLRQARGVPQLPECHYFDVDIASVSFPANHQSSTLLAEDIPLLIRRLRHMYQVGLLNLMKGVQPKAALGMMQRAVERLEIVSGNHAMSKLWLVAALGIEALKQGNVSFSKSRIQILSVLDRQIKLLQAEGISAFNREPSQTLLKAFIYWSAMAEQPSEKAVRLAQLVAYSPLGYSASELEQESESLRGPNASTMASVAAVLKDELGKTKNILELAAQASPISAMDFQELKDHLTKIAEILSVVGLTTPGNTLRQEVRKIDGWIEAGKEVGREELLEVADSMLYVESTVTDIDKFQLSDEKLQFANSISRQEVIANSQLSEAQRLALNESEQALSMIKRALSAYTEHHFDLAHIKNVPPALDGVRGALFFLGFERAAAVVTSCRLFVENALMAETPKGSLHHVLETFADAIISLEYFIDAAKHYRQPDQAVLQVAEESLSALGFPV